jgi:hypothetical protein
MPKGGSQAIVLQHLSEINQWKADGMPQREIARKLDIPESSLRGALKTIPTDVHQRISTQPSASDAQVYEGIPPTSPEALQLIEEARSLLPTIREVVQSWGVLQAMIAAYAQQQELLQVAPQYRPYDGFFSCRLSHQLIRDIKAYATEHRLSQSELVTIALQAYMRQL